MHKVSKSAGLSRPHAVGDDVKEAGPPAMAESVCEIIAMQ
jgi:hypothetical protein